ncbi:NAD(P)-dependent oxidoreductase [Puniceibacterium sp. IMCC21224]|uniref:NAD(P)-dependent oxidoreductase n=1 Tax=Puniceibacterium sp. IMCC21224 TaxID=1618204 RepID=UPI00064D847A|nr:NAD(P)-dependent oxidoreductase [Puniceibacterium sp. IMCC21224]KMK68815.1 beta-hydroxyacid dehydrogenase, 3-hydroxyisobutyrate dehydrogenase [Puniceibacterium sp. IMCC21224]
MTERTNRPDRVAFVGFGEAGTAFVSGWGQARPTSLRAYDAKTDMPETRAALVERYGKHGVDGLDTLAAALDGTEAVFCVVTADQAFSAAAAAAPLIAPGTLWFDCNSCAPGTKRRSAAVIDAAGGRYVDVAVMSPVYPKRHQVPLLIAGPHADAGEAVLSALDMKPKRAGNEVGRASSIKMLRSVMIKGMEALTAECFLAARRAGVEEEVIGSLEASDPDIKWRDRGAYNLERMMVHGTRRAAEMQEVAITVDELGLGGGMSAAAAAWQALIADLGAEPGEADLYARTDTILARL